MLKTVNARFANGVLIPLEPLDLLDLEEGAVVVLSIEVVQPKTEWSGNAPPVVPNEGDFFPDADPKRLKNLLYGQEVEGYLRKRNE